MKHFRLLLLIAMLLGSLRFSAGAQEIDTAPMWGVRVAVDLNMPGKWHGDAGKVKMYRNGFGITAGGVCNIYLGKDFYFEPGLSLFYDTYSYDGLIISDNPVGNPVEVKPSLYKFGLRLPIIFGRTVDLSDSFTLAIFTGPEISYAFAGDIRFKHKELLGDMPLTLFGKNGQQRRVDCAWIVGLGVPFNDWYATFDLAFGLVDQLKGPISFWENRLSLSLTRYF